MIHKKLLLAGAALVCAALVSGCASTQRSAEEASDALARVSAYTAPEPYIDDGSFGAMPVSAYAAVVDDGFALPAVPTDKIDPRFLRQRVVYDAGLDHEPGTVVVDTPNRFLYVVEENGMAMRYGIGVGAAGFSWAGDATIQGKQHWPKWFPPDEMIARKPELQQYDDGMEPGLQNPLGSRALYLYQGGKDTLYRLHGTPEWWTIGTAASSGCIRLINQDIIDLYERVPMNAKVVVLQGNERLASETSPATTADGDTDRS